MITAAPKVARSTTIQAEALPRYLLIYKSVLIKVSRAVKLKFLCLFKKLNQKCNI